MSIHFLTEQLLLMENAKRENRQRVANLVLRNKNLCKDLISITFTIDDKVSIKAAWILEWICTHYHLSWILPHLDEFSEKIHTLRFDSAIRSCAKICELLAIAYQSNDTNDIKQKITQIHIDTIVETGFDWLITSQKIAVKAYTMQTLYLFGLEKKWIHPELKYLIETKLFMKVLVVKFEENTFYNG